MSLIITSSKWSQVTSLKQIIGHSSCSVNTGCPGSDGALHTQECLTSTSAWEATELTKQVGDVTREAHGRLLAIWDTKCFDVSTTCTDKRPFCRG